MPLSNRTIFNLWGGFFCKSSMFFKHRSLKSLFALAICRKKAEPFRQIQCSGASHQITVMKYIYQTNLFDSWQGSIWKHENMVLDGLNVRCVHGKYRFRYFLM